MQGISAIINIKEENLLVRFLGMPLASKRILFKDCQPLINKIWIKLSGWKSKILSYAGRVELIRSTLSTFHIYWATDGIYSPPICAFCDRQIHQILLRVFMLS